MYLRGPVLTLTARREAPSLMGWLRWDGMGWDGWMDGISKVCFNFLHTLWVYRKGIYLLIYDSRQDFSTSQTIPFPFFKPKMGPQMKPMGSEKCPFFVKKFEFTKKRLLFEASILRKKVPKKVSC